MKNLLPILAITLCCMLSCEPPNPIYQSFDDYPPYDGEDLGLTYKGNYSTFKLWAPAAKQVQMHLYQTDIDKQRIKTLNLQRQKNGVWTSKINQDIKGYYYTVQSANGNEWSQEVADPYARAVGTNGKRAMVVDLKDTHPDNWENDKRPPLSNSTDAIIYELHIRDLSMDPKSGIQHKGKFLGLAELGTKGPFEVTTGLDHIKELGVTHIHLLPSYDFMSVDESKPEANQFNWGYDPLHYNIPEGSYSTNPSDGKVRIKEFKTLIKTLHENGLRVIMDVVYNHTGQTQESVFNQLVPGYYYRQKEDGSFSDASACGNETASDRPMMRQYMIESVKYWANEYHVDGFRFDLMGIHDIETMNAIRKALDEIDSSILTYGEGWTAGDSPLPENDRALKKHTYRMDRIAAFSDDMRDGVKGHVFQPEEKGWASGKLDLKESVKFGIVAATQHPQVDYTLVNYSDKPWANEPYQCINYVSCHDNHTLLDRLVNTVEDADEATLIKMHKLANTIVMTSQGIPFLHAGVEMLRTKGGEENSYKSPDAVNRLDWSRKVKYADVFNYYKSIIELRKSHPAFRMTSNVQIQKHLQFLETGDTIIAYTINGKAIGDSWKNILVVFNGSRENQTVKIPAAEWTLFLDSKGFKAEGIKKINQTEITIPASSALVLAQI